MTDRLRVCHVLSYFHPFESGAERQALAQGAELVRRGHLVQVLTRSMPGVPTVESIQGVQVHRRIRTVGIGPLFGVSFVAGVIRALGQLRPQYDLIHTHQGLWEAVATGLGRHWLGDVPTLIQPASSGSFGEAEELARTRGSPILRRLILRNTHFAAISAEIEREWLGLGVPAGSISRMASGVDAESFRPGPSGVEDRLPPRPRVMFVGRFHPQKNLDLILGAWPDVARQTQAHLVLVGWGPERERLATHSDILGVSDRVHFIGPVDDPAEYLRGADAFVLPSVAEGMSNSLLEAMASALPCLASDIGGNTDLIDDGRTGLLVTPDDPSAWSSALIRVLDDRDFARGLGNAARRRIEEEFALPRVVDRYVALYRRILLGGAKDP